MQSSSSPSQTTLRQSPGSPVIYRDQKQTEEKVDREVVSEECLETLKTSLLTTTATPRNIMTFAVEAYKASVLVPIKLQIVKLKSDMMNALSPGQDLLSLFKATVETDADKLWRTSMDQMETDLIDNAGKGKTKKSATSAPKGQDGTKKDDSMITGSAGAESELNHEDVGDETQSKHWRTCSVSLG
ncbi:hypothetical protein BGW38_002845 [Lunasporangiospora selenospora]|uniref:Uncharacterized protein n=1 Tax=Lunasporangiospora selenospora TaxID=979761 RepID=A0A9P6G0Q0_9FUNG|nr:hypothetical protein BGW38_002845 [Lunasporangiospora selenospora]